MEENIIIVNEKKYNEVLNNFKKDGLYNLHIISDFDRTLTYNYVDGEERPSLISVLRSRNILGEEYSKKAYELFDYYNPIEIDINVPIEIKKREMYDWWSKHIKLLVETGFNKNDVEKALNTGIIKLREGTIEFFKFLNEKNVPLVIISANCLGYDSIEYYLKKENVWFDNIFVESNGFIWDENGTAIGMGNSIVHTFNKDEKILKENPKIYNKIKDRKNVILLGDSVGDVGMVEGFDYDNLIKIGFLNKNIQKDLNVYKKIYDVIIIKDGDFSFINHILNEIQ